MNTTLRDLIDQLTELADELGDDVEVLLAIQPSYPLAVGIATATAILADKHDDGPRPIPTRVWIAASESVDYGVNPYAPRVAWTGGIVEALDEVDA